MEDIDMEMDIDLEFDIDPIKRFLLHKLKEVKLSNKELQRQVHCRQQLLNDYMEKTISKTNENNFEIINIWHRTFNNKWIVGIEVKNRNVIRVIRDINVALKWNLSTLFTYVTNCFSQYKHLDEKYPNCTETEIIDLEMDDDNQQLRPLENEWIKTDEIKDSACIIVVFDVPPLLDNVKCEITGILTYKDGQKFHQLNIRKFEIKASDFINNSKEIKNADIINGDEKAYLVTLTINERTDLIAQMLLDTYTSLGDILEFECNFRKIKLISKAKTFYYISSISSSIDGSFIELDKQLGKTGKILYNLSVYTRDQITLQLLLHHLQETVPGLLILPKRNKESLLELQSEEYVSQDRSVLRDSLQSDLRQFGTGLEAEVSLLEKFCNKRLAEISEDIRCNNDVVQLDVHIKDYQNFRKQLSEMELKQDLLYAKCSDFISICDNEI